MPLPASAARSPAASSSSSRPAMRSASITVTRQPSPACACAISSPTGPPPRISRWAGRSGRSNSPSWVTCGTSASPGMGGNTARLPAAMTMRRAVSRRGPSGRATSSASRPMKRACPASTVAPSAVKRAALSIGAMAAITPCTCACTAAQSMSGAAMRRPNRPAARAFMAACAAASSALLGTHPALRQSPPMRPRSISATRRPRLGGNGGDREPGGAGADDGEVEFSHGVSSSAARPPAAATMRPGRAAAAVPGPTRSAPGRAARQRRARYRPRRRGWRTRRRPA